MMVLQAKAGNEAAARIMQSWADGEWFTGAPDVPEKYTVTVFKVRYPHGHIHTGTYTRAHT